MAANFVPGAERGSLLLELLCFAGWQLQIREGRPARIRARRDDVELEVAGVSLAKAAGIVLAGAIRSGNGGRTEDD